MGEQEIINVIVADDQPLMRDGLVSLLEVQPHISIVGIASNGQEVLDLMERVQPHVVLMDVRMPGMNGIEATRQIRQAYPECQVLMLTTFDDEEFVVQALLAGAAGYLLKTIPTDDLAQAIRAVHHGIFQFDAGISGTLVGAMTNLKPPPVEDDLPLTQRQKEILGLIAKGATNREIALKLNISEGTVKNAISLILSQLDLRDRTQAAIYAHRHGLL